MLEFEDEMKHVKRGYVVLSLDEYDGLRDEIAAANMRVYEAEQLANRRIAEAAQNNKRILDSLFKIEKKEYGSENIEIVFDRHALYTLAVERLYETFSAPELEGYTVAPASVMILCDETIATRVDNKEPLLPKHPDDTED